MTESKKKDTDIETAKRVLEALRRDPRLREQFFEVIEPGLYVKRDEFSELLHEIKQLRLESNERFEESRRRFEESDKRFEAMQRDSRDRFETMQQQIDRRFEESDKRFEAMQQESRERFETMQQQIDRRFEESDKRFEAMQQESRERFETMQQQIDRRFEESDKRFEAMQQESRERFETMQQQIDRRFEESRKRFEAMQQQIDRRFEESDKRFEAMQQQIDRRFDKVFERFDELSLALGHDFEEFNSYWLETFLLEQGYPKVAIKKRHLFDKNYTVFPNSKDVEVDLFNEEPLVIGEVTAIVRSIDKVTVFLKKIKFIEKELEREAEYKIFITYAIDPEIREEAVRLLKEGGVTLFTLRRPLKTD